MNNDYASITMKIRNQAVSGSQTRLNVRNGETNTLLVDNGAFQNKEGENLPAENYSDVKAVFLTHAHIDHSGGLGEIQRQVSVPVYATPATNELIVPMINDMYNILSMHGEISQGEATEAINKLRGKLNDVKLYSKMSFGNYEVTYLDNAHILGSSMVMVKALDKHRDISILFSGDYREDHPFIRTHGVCNFIKKNPIDVLVLESTYGNKQAHITFDESLDMLEEILFEALCEKKGTALLGSFSIDRTPVLLYMISQIQKRNPLLADYPVWLDGSLAKEGLRVYKNNASKFKCSWSEIIPQNFAMVQDKEERSKVQNDIKPKIVIGTSGQFHGGSIVSWVSKLLSDRRATIVSTGYIAHELGQKLFEVEDGEMFNYFGQEIQVNATRKVLTGTSAHADCNGLAKFVEKCCKYNPKLKVILTHGDPEAKTMLRHFLATEMILPFSNIYIQEENQHFEINKHTLSTGEILVND